MSLPGVPVFAKLAGGYWRLFVDLTIGATTMVPTAGGDGYAFAPVGLDGRAQPGAIEPERVQLRAGGHAN